MAQIQQVLDRLDDQLDNAVGRLFELVRIQSISTDPAYAVQCMLAADWLVKDLNGIGFNARMCPTEGHPMVLAHYRGPADAPHVLFYGHYDVQPVDPVSLWKNPPFEPKVEDGKLLGRGTSDDKGQLMTFVEAARAFRDVTGGLPLNVTILFEGEEESGSPSLKPFLEAHKDELKADVALVCDTNMWDRSTPAISTGLRGLVGEEVVIKAASRDLHSGYYGSAAANPINILTKILSGLRDENGAVTLPGFYDGVPETPPEIKAMWDGLGFSPEKFLGAIGLSVPAGEKGRSILEQTWARPTAEINGITGGYTGEGFKTVIPAEARAKVSFRLVGTQDPERIRQSFRAYVQSMLPPDCKAEFHQHGGSPAIHLDYTLPELKKATAALKEEWGRDTALIAMGGSIPIVGDFQKMLGIPSLLIGFAHADDQIHSPNEKYELTSFHKGMRSWARVMQALAG
ncbi:MAG: dipeptidase [Nitratireductor sp.]|jgi:acetylornithine deacetylase/succinyl-diaminopimelate desuccinylase-like protein|nr:dipeptidase [Nitratireductor sp.]